MSVQLNPYLCFRDNAAEAMSFYQSVFGGQVSTMTFGDMPDMPGNDESIHHLVMHSALDGDAGVHLMGSDTPPSMDLSPNGTQSLSGTDESTLKGFWDKLSDGAQVTMPLEKAPWGDSFGTLTDKFGISWMFNVAGTQD